MQEEKKNTSALVYEPTVFFLFHGFHVNKMHKKKKKIKAKSTRGMPRRRPPVSPHCFLDDASLLPFKHKGKSQGQSWLTIG